METINGVTCIKGEIHNIMTLLRLNTRWVAATRFTRELLIQDESPMVQSFRLLNEYLEGTFILRNVDCLVYLQPFHQIIISEQASGPLTSAALSSLSKFVSYGFLSPYYLRSNEGIRLIASCISECIFEETDWESDEVILMKLLELSTLCLRCDASSMLTVSAAWDIYSTCLSIYCQHRASKLLKSEAETALRHLTLTTFSRAVLYSHDNPTDNKTSEEDTISTSAGISSLLVRIISSLSDLINPQTQSISNIKFFLSLINIALEAGGPALGCMTDVVSILRGDICRHLLSSSQSSDLAVFSLALRVVFNLFASIKDHMKVQLEVFLTSVHLRILQVPPSNNHSLNAREELALESLLEFCREPSLMHDIYTNYDCDVQCTNLFDSIISVLCERAAPCVVLGRTRDEPSRTFINILNRLSLEGLLIILHAVAVRCAASGPSRPPKSRSPPADTNAAISANESSSSLPTIEEDVDRWCQLDGSVGDEDSYTRCESPDKQQKKLLEVPDFGRATTGASTDDALMNEDDVGDSEFIYQARARTAEILRQRKTKKQHILLAAQKFNEAPLKADWIILASELTLLPKIKTDLSKKPSIDKLVDAKSVALFLKNTPGLGKTQIGEFLSKGPRDKYPFHAEVLTEYVNTFTFRKNISFVKALRIFLSQFRLPGEAQCIDRLMEAFAIKLFNDLGPDNPFHKSDGAFILAFSTIMLNTDLHSRQIAKNKKMTLDEFIRNNRGINDNKDLPREFLENLYNEIKNHEIQVEHSLADNMPIDYSDNTSWNKLLRRSAEDQAPASFTPTVTARRIGLSGGYPISAHEQDMFIIMGARVLDAIIDVWEVTEDDFLICRMIEGLWDYVVVCVKLNLLDMVDSIVQLLVVVAYRSLKNLKPHESPLLSMDMEKLLDAKKSLDPQWQQQWIGVRHIRGLILLRLVFYVYGKYLGCMGEGSLAALVQLLLYFYRNSNLPRHLLEIDDFSDARGNKLAPSLFAKQSKVEEVEQDVSLWNSIGGIFWSSKKPATTSSPPASAPDSGNSMITQTLSLCRIDHLLFVKAKEISEEKLVQLIDAMLAATLGMHTHQNEEKHFSKHHYYISDFFDDMFCNGVSDVGEAAAKIDVSKTSSALINGTESVIESIFTKYFNMERINDADAVIILEWIGRVVLVNRMRAAILWPRIHCYFTCLLEYKVNSLCETYPYLIERCIVAIIRACLHLSEYIPQEEGNVWSSLRLLKGVPHSMLCHVADRLGAGLLTLIRGSLQSNVISSLDQWYLIFSLLSSATSGEKGRPFVWEAVCFLIDNNYINNMNFTPCRHLVLRVFPGEDEIEAGAPRLKNPWLAGSLFHIMRLTLMALAGYTVASRERHAPTDDAEYVTFPLPLEDDVIAVDKQSVNRTISVVCVNFSQVQDVEILWSETLKTIAEFAGCTPVEVSKHSTFCIQALFIAGHLSSMPRELWHQVLQELIQRLPLLVKPKQHSGGNGGTYEVSLRCCVVMFDIIVLHSRMLLANDGFNPSWIKYMTILARNVCEGSANHAYQGEIVDMIGSLLRILNLPPRSSDNKHQETAETKELDAERLSSLLMLSWKSVVTVCPALRNLLRVKYSQVLNTIATMEYRKDDSFLATAAKILGKDSQTQVV